MPVVRSRSSAPNELNGSWFDYFGGTPDTNVKCRRVDLAFNGNLTGHTIQVRFTGQKGYANTFMRIHSITFFQGL